MGFSRASCPEMCKISLVFKYFCTFSGSESGTRTFGISRKRKVLQGFGVILVSIEGPGMSEYQGNARFHKVLGDFGRPFRTEIWKYHENFDFLLLFNNDFYFPIGSPPRWPVSRPPLADGWHMRIL